MLEYLSQPWPWYVAGPLIALTMFLLILFGKSFGVSSTLRTMCTIGGAGKWSSFFNIDWKRQMWNLVFILGTLIGGFLAGQYLMDPSYEVGISENTVKDLKAIGVKDPGKGFVPKGIFSWEALTTVRGVVFLLLGGFLVGFGARYAGGCTSGHAISGLANLQFPSLIAVIGFFIGGLIMTYLILPYLIGL